MPCIGARTLRQWQRSARTSGHLPGSAALSKLAWLVLLAVTLTRPAGAGKLEGTELADYNQFFSSRTKTVYAVYGLPGAGVPRLTALLECVGMLLPELGDPVERPIKLKRMYGAHNLVLMFESYWQERARHAGLLRMRPRALNKEKEAPELPPFIAQQPDYLTHGFIPDLAAILASQVASPLSSYFFLHSFPSPWTLPEPQSSVLGTENSFDRLEEALADIEQLDDLLCNTTGYPWDLEAPAPHALRYLVATRNPLRWAAALKQQLQNPASNMTRVGNASKRTGLVAVAEQSAFSMLRNITIAEKAWLGRLCQLWVDYTGRWLHLASLPSSSDRILLLRMEDSLPRLTSLSLSQLGLKAAPDGFKVAEHCPEASLLFPPLADTSDTGSDMDDWGKAAMELVRTGLVSQSELSAAIEALGQDGLLLAVLLGYASPSRLPDHLRAALRAPSLSLAQLLSQTVPAGAGAGRGATGWAEDNTAGGAKKEAGGGGGGGGALSRLWSWVVQQDRQARPRPPAADSTAPLAQWAGPLQYPVPPIVHMMGPNTACGVDYAKDWPTAWLLARWSWRQTFQPEIDHAVSIMGSSFSRWDPALLSNRSGARALFPYWTDDLLVNFVREQYPVFYPMLSKIMETARKVNQANRIKVLVWDFVRFLLLHHYGGVYADLDVILKRDFSAYARVLWALTCQLYRAEGAIYAVGNVPGGLDETTLLELQKRAGSWPEKGQSSLPEQSWNDSTSLGCAEAHFAAVVGSPLASKGEQTQNALMISSPRHPFWLFVARLSAPRLLSYALPSRSGGFRVPSKGQVLSIAGPLLLDDALRLWHAPERRNLYLADWSPVSVLPHSEFNPWRRKVDPGQWAQQRAFTMQVATNHWLVRQGQQDEPGRTDARAPGRPGHAAPVPASRNSELAEALLQELRAPPPAELRALLRRWDCGSG